jgi:hypothetical protein
MSDHTIILNKILVWLNRNLTSRPGCRFISEVPISMTLGKYPQQYYSIFNGFLRRKLDMHLDEQIATSSAFEAFFFGSWKAHNLIKISPLLSWFSPRGSLASRMTQHEKNTVRIIKSSRLQSKQVRICLMDPDFQTVLE